MIEALVRCGEADKAWDLVHHKQACQDVEQGAGINTVIYSTLLKGFAVAKNIDKVFAVHEEMRQQGVAGNTITYNTMLDACAKCNAMSKAEHILEVMRAASVEPDIITYSTIIKGHCLEGDIDKALAILKEMRSNKNMEPDEIMYNSFLDGCAKQYRVDEALAALEEMQAAGVNPSNFTLSILVKLLGRARRLNQAFTLMDDLSKRHGFRPNVQVYTCLMQACIQNRKLDRALALHDTMVSAGCRPDEKMYTGLVRGCLQLRAPQKAADVARAAYELPGSTLTVSKKGVTHAGVERHVMVEVWASLHGGSKEDQAVGNALAFDMEKLRGICITHGSASMHSGPARRGGASQR
jgi:pentatricopeptide repeat protein